MLGVPLGELAVLAAAIVIGGVDHRPACRAVRRRRRRGHRPCALRDFPRARRAGGGADAALRRHLARHHRADLAALVPGAPRQGQSAGRDHPALGAVVIAGIAAGAVIAAFAPSWVFKLAFVVVTSPDRHCACCSATRAGGSATRCPAPALMAVYGFIIGFYSAVMGVGGGSVSTLRPDALRQRRSMSRSAISAGHRRADLHLSAPSGSCIAGWPQQALMPPLSIGYVSLIGVALMAPIAGAMSRRSARGWRTACRSGGSRFAFGAVPGCWCAVRFLKS